MRASLYRGLYIGRLQRDQVRRPAGQGADRRARADRRRARDRAAEVPARRHLLERAYKAAKRCAPLKADGFAHPPVPVHGAPDRAPAAPTTSPIGALSRLTRALDKLAQPQRAGHAQQAHDDLYLTEFGYLTKGNRAQTPKVRAAWLTPAYKIARRNPRVRQLLQYQLIDRPADRPWHSAAMTRRGVPQAPFKALARLARQRH